MNHPKISDAEWVVMEVLWECSPRTASDVVSRLDTDWAENTVRTLLTRLVKKGALKTGKTSAGIRTFRPAFSREAFVKVESESFVQRIFRGAAKPLITHFAQNSRLSREEVSELKRILDESLKRREGDK